MLPSFSASLDRQVALPLGNEAGKCWLRADRVAGMTCTMLYTPVTPLNLNTPMLYRSTTTGRLQAWVAQMSGNDEQGNAAYMRQGATGTAVHKLNDTRRAQRHDVAHTTHVTALKFSVPMLDKLASKSCLQAWAKVWF